MKLQEVLNKYDSIESQMLYNKAIEILELISDNELGDLMLNHSTLFSKISGMTHE